VRPRGGYHAQPVRQGSCPQRAAKRQGERTPRPIRLKTWANTIVKLHVRDREFVCKGALWGLAKAGVFSPRGTGMADGTALETTERDPGGG
jgi:hypothetical protein